MAEVGIKGFRAGDSEEHGTKRDQAYDAMMKEKIQAVKWVECPEHFRIAGDP